MQEQIKKLNIELKIAVNELDESRKVLVTKYRFERFNKKKLKINEQAIFEKGIQTGIEITIKKLDALEFEEVPDDNNE